MDAVTHLSPRWAWWPPAMCWAWPALPSIGSGRSWPIRFAPPGAAPSRGSARFRAGPQSGRTRQCAGRPKFRAIPGPLSAAVQATCWTKVSTSARRGPCIASWKKRANPANAAINSCIRFTRNQSCSPPHPTNFGAGHHQAAGTGQVDLLLSLCHPRRLQPLRRRLDGRPSGGAELAKQFLEETIRKHQIPLANSKSTPTAAG